MKSIAGKRQVLHDSVSRRLRDRELYGSGHVSRSYLVFSLLMICVASSSGLYFGYKAGSESVETPDFLDNQTVSVDDYNITLLPDSHEYMNGTTIGLNRKDFNHRFYIQDDLSKKVMESTCIHEKLHDLGLPGGDTDGHDWVYVQDGRISDRTCTLFIERLEEMDYFS
jgi:hypothetical protein